MNFIKKLLAMLSGDPQPKIERNLKYISSPKVMREDRQMAIDFFCRLKNAEQAVPALLLRFEFSLEHGINDTREKEAVLEGIIKHGKEGLPFIKAHLTGTSRIAWPIKALKGVASDQEVIDILKSCLDFGDTAFQQNKIDKNYDILCYLRDFQLPGFVDQLKHFIEDKDERVRFAAVECLIEQDDERIPSLVEKYIGDNSAENTRLRQAVMEAFLAKGWRMSRPELYEANPVIAPGIRVAKDGSLHSFQYAPQR